jgi:hypothetical protein
METKFDTEFVGMCKIYLHTKFRKTSPKIVLLATRFMYVSSLVYYSTLKMEATRSSKTSVDFQQTTRRYIPEDRILYNHGYENLKFYTVNNLRDP